ncbi:MAG TPA: protein-disulfide reductase DsbD family protein [Candidatus Krumholzibacteria bacterium]|nr:protein-disulfide reductase DsbD family protein [Candidatus Krumholzibacteria bacterium]HRX52648.1 protein-disulfide reductase DsbD family protein [Candidatus Krumholzibacteria bacterium]
MKTLLLCAALLLTALPATAQGMKDSSSVVTVTTAPDTVRAGVGGTVAFTVTLAVQDGWHLYAHGDPTYYGISLNAPENLPLAGVQVEYPAGHQGKFLGETITLLEKTVEIGVEGMLMVQPEAPLTWELELQACDDKSCLAPAWVPVTVTVLPAE